MQTATLVPVEEYLSTSYRPDREYLDGVLLERNVGDHDHSRQQMYLSSYLFVREEQWGIHVVPEQRVQVKPRNYRVPDICVLAHGAAPTLIYTEPPFLCIEILSKDDTMSEMLERINDYLDFGVPYVWVIDPRKRRAWVYTRGAMQEASDGMLRTRNPDIAVPLSEILEQPVEYVMSATVIASETQPGALTVLTEEERLFQSTVRRFAREQIAPHVREMDEAGLFRQDILRQFFELGLMGIEIPEEYGGQGGTFFQCIIAVEELSAVDPSAGVIVNVQNTIANNAILRWANADQKRRYLPRLAADTVASYALSEAGSGSDAFALATTASDQGDHFLLNGRKLWITNAAESGLFLLFANANPPAGYRGITAFLIERDFAGFAVGKKEDKLGLRASSTCELILDNCRVPKENVLGELGKGYKIAIETLNEGRIAIGSQMIGLARGALDHALAYARQRKQFGKAIAEFQGVQFQLAVMATELEAARLLVYNAARLRDSGRPFVTEAAMAKYYSSEIAEKVASKAIEVFGGIGVTKECPVEKLYRDAKIGRIYEGTSNIQLVTIARQLLG